MVIMATNSPIRWSVQIDWAGDGSWDANTADISDDVLGLRWQWGRRGLPVPEFAPPAELELTLRNYDHRYTLGNVSGPLAGNVQPNRAVWLRASRMHDDFAADHGASANLNERTAPVGDARWAVLAVAGNGFAVSDGMVRGEGGGWPPSDAVALLDTGDRLATLTAGYRRGSNGQGGLALRCAAVDDCLRLRFANDASILEHVSGRIVTRLSDGAPLDADVWYHLEIEQTASSVRVYAIEIGQAGADWREILAATDMNGTPESGRHGLWHGFRNAQDRWDNFGVGRSLFTGRITGIDPDHEAGACRIAAADMAQRLETVHLHRALPGGLMRSGNVAAAILGWAGLTSGEYELDDGRMLLTGGPRSVWGVSAGRALRRLQREEHGFMYADGRARVRLEAATRRESLRNRPNPVSAARFSIGDIANTDDPYAMALHRDDGANAVEDSVTFRYRRSSDEGRQRVWSLNEALEIPADGEQLVLVATDSWDMIDGLGAPASGTDYTATDDAAGAGTDATDDITIEFVAEVESGIIGKGRVVRIINRGTGTAYLQSLDLYADHCWRTQTSSAVRVRSNAASGSTALTGRSRLIGCRYADHHAAAQGAAQARLADRSSQRPHVEVELQLPSEGNRRAATESRISDVVEMRAAAQGITGAWFLEGMEVTVKGGGDGEARWWLTEV